MYDPCCRAVSPRGLSYAIPPSELSPNSFPPPHANFDPPSNGSFYVRPEPSLLASFIPGDIIPQTLAALKRTFSKEGVTSSFKIHAASAVGMLLTSAATMFIMRGRSPLAIAGVAAALSGYGFEIGEQVITYFTGTPETRKEEIGVRKFLIDGTWNSFLFAALGAFGMATARVGIGKGSAFLLEAGFFMFLEESREHLFNTRPLHHYARESQTLPFLTRYMLSVVNLLGLRFTGPRLMPVVAQATLPKLGGAGKWLAQSVVDVQKARHEAWDGILPGREVWVDGVPSAYLKAAKYLPLPRTSEELGDVAAAMGWAVSGFIAVKAIGAQFFPESGIKFPDAWNVVKSTAASSLFWGTSRRFINPFVKWLMSPEGRRKTHMGMVPEILVDATFNAAGVMLQICWALDGGTAKLGSALTAGFFSGIGWSPLRVHLRAKYHPKTLPVAIGGEVNRMVFSAPGALKLYPAFQMGPIEASVPQMAAYAVIWAGHLFFNKTGSVGTACKQRIFTLLPPVKRFFAVKSAGT